MLPIAAVRCLCYDEGMNIFWSLIFGVIAYFVAHLVFNDVVSVIIGLAVAASIIFGYDRFIPRR